MGSVGIYFILKEEENLPLCLKYLQELGDTFFLVEKSGQEDERVALSCRNRINSLFHKAEEENGAELFFSCLEEPSAAACNGIGEAFFRQEKWKQAVFWFENALRLEGGAFPCLRLRICYEALEEWEKAEAFGKLGMLWQKKKGKPNKY